MYAAKIRNLILKSILIIIIFILCFAQSFIEINLMQCLFCLCGCVLLKNNIVFILNDNYNACTGLYTQKNNNQITSYIINMDRSTKRLEYILPQINQLGFPIKKLKAIDGLDLTKERMRLIVSMESFVKFFNKFPELGTIGCSLSHEYAWKKFLESDDEFALIFEDDVTFNSVLLKDIVNNLIENKNMWDIVSFELSHNGMPLKIKKILSNTSEMNKQHNNYYLSLYLTRTAEISGACSRDG